MDTNIGTTTFLLISLFCCGSVEQVYMPTTYSLLDICGQKISISEDMILTLSVNDTSESPRLCQASIESDVFKNRLLIQFLDIDIPASPECRETSVRVTGTQGNYENGIICGYNTSTPVFNSTGQSVHVEYRSAGHPEDATNASFTLLISSFHIQIGSCDSYEFACSNSLCIDDDMSCNGYNDCSDNSDETIGCQQSFGDSKHILEIVTLSVVGGIFLITVTVVCVVKIRRARATRGKYLPID